MYGSEGTDGAQDGASRNGLLKQEWISPKCAEIQTELQYQFLSIPLEWNSDKMDFDQPYIMHRDLPEGSPFRYSMGDLAEAVKRECGEAFMIPWCVYSIMTDTRLFTDFLRALAQADIDTLFGTHACFYDPVGNL